MRPERAGVVAARARPPPRRRGSRGRRDREPGRAARRATRARPAAAPPSPGRRASAAARSSARERRVATRSWCRASGSAPSRTPGSFVSTARYWATSRERRRSIGCRRRVREPAPRRAPRTRAELRRPVRRPRARLAQLPCRSPERLPASLDHLGLELGEPSHGLGAVEDGDVVEYDLDPIGAPRRPWRPGAGYGAWPPASRSAPPRSNAGSRSRRAAGTRPGPPALLELEAAVRRGQLQLPEADPLLDAPPERDPAVEQPPARRVVVGRGEGALRRPAAERGQLEAGVDVELELAFQGRLHGAIVAALIAKLAATCRRS